MVGTTVDAKELAPRGLAAPRGDGEPRVVAAPRAGEAPSDKAPMCVAVGCGCDS